MSERVLDRVVEMADQLREQAPEAERIGRLTDDTVKKMKAAGLIRLLQTKQYQGFEVHPREFAETTMATAALDPAAGWIVGVVGVHPYQLAYADPKVAAEIWADDVDTWMASRTRHRVSLGPSTVATSSPGAGSSARAPTTATGSSWAPCSPTPRAYH
jgi:alkylation response protein AidB-like acyl-CoA dehydrogenase